MRGFGLPTHTLGQVLVGTVCIALALGGSRASAQEFQLVIDDPNTDASLVQQEMGPDVIDSFRLGDQQELLEQMAAATALSARGMGVDYASSPQRFVLGGSVGSALNGTGAGFGYGDGLLPQGGFAFQGSAMAGLNLGAFVDDKHPLRRFVLYGHGMAAGGGRDPFSARAVNGGGHLQVQVLRVRDMGPAGWGGLALTTGFEHTAYALTLEQSVPIETTVATWEADGSYEVQARTNSVPIELSTNMRAAFITVYGGGGVDFMIFGDSQSDIDLRGELTDDDGSRVGEALISWSDAIEVSGVTPRFFGGLQINIFMVKLYGQLNVSSPAGFGGHTGLRVAM
jgi:hypothetical protein